MLQLFLKRKKKPEMVKMKLRKIKLHQVSRKTIKRKEAMTVLAVIIIKLLRGRRTKIVIILRKLH